MDEFTMQPGGTRLLAMAIAGTGAHIDTLIVEYGENAVLSRQRSQEDFEGIGGGEAGFMKLPVTSSSVESDGTLAFTALVTPSDAADLPANTELACVTMACADGLVCTALFDPPVAVNPDTYTTVVARMRIGG